MILFQIVSHEVTQEYLQSKDKHTWNVYLKYNKRDMETLGLSADELIKLISPPYGLYDDGYYWGETLENNLFNKLGMKKPVEDPLDVY